MKVVILSGPEPPPRPAETAGRADTTDAGVAAVGSGGHWALLNVSSAVARRLGAGQALPGMPPGAANGARTVLLSDAQLEHAAGLLGLRDGAPIELYVTPAVFEELTVQLAVLPVLQHYCGVHWRVIPVAGDRRRASFRVAALPLLEFTALAVDGDALPHAAAPRAVTGDHLALVVRDLVTGRRVFRACGALQLDADAQALLHECDCVLLDGPCAGPALDWLDRLPARHKVVFGAADERHAQTLAQRGIALARDGLAIEL